MSFIPELFAPDRAPVRLENRIPKTSIKPMSVPVEASDVYAPARGHSELNR